MEAWNKYLSTRLSDVIFKLKKDGYNIESKYEKPGKTNYVRYYLIQEQQGDFFK